jgi:hypothetical protein
MRLSTQEIHRHTAKVKGGALTYARRYALFRLAGIAGEGDLDALELLADPQPQPRN